MEDEAGRTKGDHQARGMGARTRNENTSAEPREIKGDGGLFFTVEPEGAELEG